ncbi:MAG: VOC family protein [Lentisphaeria bacterium]|nr:VOC family protein [Lentisphaeria bacterium]NQZ68464.1 VOC family protein [Lentisphaeria bacterium]
MITELNHYNLLCPMGLIEKLKEFYIEVLGFEVGFRPGFHMPGYWLYRNGKPFIHLFEGNDELTPAANYLNHIAFTVTELEPLLEKLNAHNIIYKESAIDEINLTQIFFEDPSGLRIELNYTNKS